MIVHAERSAMRTEQGIREWLKSEERALVAMGMCLSSDPDTAWLAARKVLTINILRKVLGE